VRSDVSIPSQSELITPTGYGRLIQVPPGAILRTKESFVNESYFLPCAAVVSLPGGVPSSSPTEDVLFSIQVPSGSLATLPAGIFQKVLVPPGVRLEAHVTEEEVVLLPDSPPFDVTPGEPFIVEHFPVELCVPGNTTVLMPVRGPSS
jgi:hypothetical protein